MHTTHHPPSASGEAAHSAHPRRAGRERLIAWKVLIVEDDERLIHLVEAALKGEGFETVIARDGVGALRAIREERPDLVIVNGMLPWVGGSPVGQERRVALHGTEPAIIVMSGLGEESEKTRALKAGADDYLTKPVQAKELIARIKTIQGRAAPAGILRAGPIDVDLTRWSVSVEGEAVTLTTKEFRLLRKLLEVKGRILTREVLRETVWGHGRAHRFETRTVDVHVGRLRRKLGLAGRYLITVRGVGYRFRKF